jgi:uncharacterized protein YggE
MTEEYEHEHEPEHAAPARGIRTNGTVVAATVVLAAVLLGGAGLGLALTDAGASTPAGAPAGCGGSNPKLTVQGTGQAFGTPDVLTAVFGFSSTAGTTSAALSQNNAKVSQALAALGANGVASRDVQTTGLSLQAQYAYPHGVPTLTGYSATNTITATLRNTATAGAAIDAVVNATGDAAQINSLTFSFGNPTAVEDQARADAVHQAVSHAHAMAMASGRTLGPVCALTDNTQPTGPYPPAGLDYAQNAAGSASAVPVEPGTQTETDQVTLVYALRSR